MPKSTSGPVLLASILTGLLIGLVAGAYVLYAWAPPELVLQNAPPRLLAYDGVNPQYRDAYLVAMANRYGSARDRQRALRDAADFLGITSGDSTVSSAIDMLNNTRRIVADENKSKGVASRFTQQDEVQLSTLSSDIERSAKDAPGAGTLLNRPSDVNRLVPRIAGFLLLLAMAGLGFLIIKILGNRADRLAAEWDAPHGGPPPAGNVTVNVNAAEQVALDAGNPADDSGEEPLRDPSSPLTWQAAPPITAPGAAQWPSQQTARMPAAPVVVGAVMPIGALSAPQQVMSAHAPPAATYMTPPMAGTPAARPLTVFPPTTYTYSDPESDSYEEDFQIAGTLSELLGECGISVAERIGDEAPRRVPALSVWVFDKQSFNNTTKVLVTDGAAADPAWRARLAAKGEPVIAREGGAVEIVTATLRVEARATGLTLDPSGQYFETITVTFSVQKR